MNLEPDTVKDVRGYRNQESGKFYPATGSVLDLLFPDQMTWIDQAALDEGTLCHLEMASACKWRQIAGEWPAAKSKRVGALIKYLDEQNFHPEESEEPHASLVYGHAGTPDALLRRHNVYVLPDWKFAETIGLRFHFQVQAYAHFFELEKKPVLMIIQVDREAHVYPRVIKPSAKHWTLFLNALAVLQWRLR